MRYVATVGGRKYTIDLQENGHLRRVTLDDREFSMDFSRIGGAYPVSNDIERADHYSALIDDHSYEAFVRAVVQDGEAAESGERTLEVMIHGRPYMVSVQDERSQMLSNLAGGAHISGDAQIRAPMPGLVANVLATEGDEVARGQTVVVLEAMKMENDLAAPRAGHVKAVRVAKGQTVNQGDLLAVVGDIGAVPPVPQDDEEEA